MGCVRNTNYLIYTVFRVIRPPFVMTRTLPEIAAMNLDTEFARKNMVLQQIRCWDVSSPMVLDALNNVPREHFVPEQYAELAFADVMLPLGEDPAGHEHMMLKPQLEGRILQELKTQPTDCALVIGTGSGYLTACLAQLTRQVTSIDSSAHLIALAEQHLDELGITNVDLAANNIVLTAIEGGRTR